MAEYRVTGIDQESGTRATDKITAATLAEAAAKARRRAITPESVEPSNAPAPADADAPSRAGSDAGMPPWELIEKSTPRAHKRVLLGWGLLLFALPLSIYVLFIATNQIEPDWLALVLQIVVPLAIIAAAVWSFSTYWKR